MVMGVLPTRAFALITDSTAGAPATIQAAAAATASPIAAGQGRHTTGTVATPIAKPVAAATVPATSGNTASSVLRSEVERSRHPPPRNHRPVASAAPPISSAPAARTRAVRRSPAGGDAASSATTVGPVSNASAGRLGSR